MENTEGAVHRGHLRAGGYPGALTAGRVGRPGSAGVPAGSANRAGLRATPSLAVPRPAGDPLAGDIRL